MAETRITAGVWRGRVIGTPPGGSMRPTRSLVREAIFNILGDRVVEASVLDLFAGAGSLGFEALSRGASSSVFVERDPVARRLIAATADRFGCRDRVRIIGADVVTWLRRRPLELDATDVCFVDAPYRSDALVAALELLGASPPPLVVCEHHHARDVPDSPGGLRQVRTVRYGLTDLTLYQPPPPAEEQR